MPLFDKKPPQGQKPENSQEKARAIYGHLIAGLSETNILEQGLIENYEIWMGEWVKNKAKNLETDAIVSIVADSTQTDVQWASSVSVQLLNKITVLEDVIKYNPSYDEDRTFAEFVIAMTQGE